LALEEGGKLAEEASKRESADLTNSANREEETEEEETE